MADDKQSVFDFDNILGMTDVFEVLGKKLDELEKRLKKFSKVAEDSFKKVNPNDDDAVEKNVKNLKQLEQVQKVINKQRETNNKTKKKAIDLTEDELILSEKQKKEQKERVQRAKQLAIINNKETGQIEKLRAKLSLTTLEWKKLSKEELENGKKGKSLIATKKKLTDELKKLEKQTGDTRRNVGNYSDSLGKLGKIAARVFVGRTIVDGLRSIAGGVTDLIEKNRDADKSIGELGDAFDETGGALKTAALGLLKIFAPALKFVAKLITSIVEILFGANTGLKEFSATSDELSETTKALTDSFAKESAELAIVFGGLKNVAKGSDEHKAAIEKINTAYGKYLPNLLTEKSTLIEIARAQDIASEALTKTFLLKIQQATLEDVVTNKVKDQIERFEKLSEVTDKNGNSIKGNVSQLNKLIGGLGDFDNAATKSFKRLTDSRGVFDRFNNVLRQSDPALADFLSSIKDLEEPTRNVLINQINAAIRTSNKYNGVISETNASIEDIASSIVTYDHAIVKSTDSTKKNTIALKDNTAARVAAIEGLQQQLLDSESGSVEERRELALRLEDAKFKAEQAQREQNFDKFIGLIENQELFLISVYGKNSAAVISFRDKAAKELAQVEELNLKLSESQLEDSEQRKLDIRKKFALKTTEIEVITEEKRLKGQKDAIDKFNAAFGTSTDKIKQQQDDIRKAEEDAINKSNEKKKDSTKKLLDDINQVTKAISAAIVDTFKKQADAASEVVKSQADAVEVQRKRAEAGLSNTLKSEQEALAAAEGDKQRAQKKAENAAKILALINLVSAAAASGDENAVATALTQFALLEVLAAGLDSFYDGTEDTGTTRNPLDSKGGRLIIAHPNERIMTSKQNNKLLAAGMSNDEVVQNALLGDAIKRTSILNMNHYKQQTEDFSKATQKGDYRLDTGPLEASMRRVEIAIKNQPKIEEKLENFTKNSVDISKRVTKGLMTRIYKEKHYL